MKPTLLILAAGVGSRYGSLKQIDQLGPSGEKIIDYSVYDARRSGFGKVVFVIRKEFEKEFNEIFITRLSKYIDVDYVFQELDNLPEGLKCPVGRTKPWGTAHAVLVAEPKIKEPFAVINADDFYGLEAFQGGSDFLSGGGGESEFCMMGYMLENTLSEHGFVSRGECVTDYNNYLKKVTERTQIAKQKDGIYYKNDDNELILLPANTVVSMNYWGFRPLIFNHIKRLFTDFITKNIDNLKSEFYIPTAIDEMIKNKTCSVKVLNSSAKWFGVTYKEDKPLVVKKLEDYVKKGLYPSPLWT